MTKRKLGEILIEEGKIDELQLKSALSHQRRWGKRLGECLVELKFLTEIDLAHSLSVALKVPVIDLTKISPEKITNELLNRISLAIVRKHRIVPIAEKEVRGKRRLVLASSDPTNVSVIDDIQFKTGTPVLLMVAPDSDIEWFIRKYYLGELEALSSNFVSGISVIDPKEKEDNIALEPVSSIFFDEAFTGIRQVRPNRDDDDSDD